MTDATGKPMRKVVLAMFVSLDGFIEGPGKQMVPPAYSADLDRYWIKPNTDAGTILYGRVCYELMAAFWTSPQAPQPNAKILGETPKIVFSRTLQTASWSNTTIVRDDIAGTVGKLRQQPGKDVILIGGAAIAGEFMRLGLIDEYRLLVSPLILGAGTPLFPGGIGRISLTLAGVQPFDTGAVLLTYRRA